jgi:hypothetical protein
MSKPFPWLESIDIIHQLHGEERVPKRRAQSSARLEGRPLADGAVAILPVGHAMSAAP